MPRLEKKPRRTTDEKPCSELHVPLIRRQQWRLQKATIDECVAQCESEGQLHATSLQAKLCSRQLHSRKKSVANLLAR